MDVLQSLALGFGVGGCIFVAIECYWAWRDWQARVQDKRTRDEHQRRKRAGYYTRRNDDSPEPRRPVRNGV